MEGGRSKVRFLMRLSFFVGGVCALVKMFCRVYFHFVMISLFGEEGTVSGVLFETRLSFAFLRKWSGGWFERILKYGDPNDFNFHLPVTSFIL